jgi:peptidoglycan/xylan/chitin deacetylase (PgdA/CDA1 family)
MRNAIDLVTKLLLLFVCFCCQGAWAENSVSVPILVYHNLNPTIPGAMSITPDKLAAQLKWIKDNGYTVIPLNDLVAYLQGKNITIPAKSVVITADDGWESIYKYMYPLVRQYHIPVTLFIYPATISEGAHAMTWAQLKELQQTGLFDIQGHTYWHPNFKQEKRHLSESEYQKFVHNQLYTSKEILDKKLGTHVTLLAWPFGIYNDYLEQAAANAGYVMAFSIDDRRARRSDKAMAQPRYMIIDSENMKTFERIIRG